MASLNMTSSLDTAIPGFSRNTSKASNVIGQLLAGKLTTGERSSIYNAGAERGVLNGMPGSTGVGGSLFANSDLKNIGLASGERQQQGIQDLLSMLGQYSGTVVPTAGQELQNDQFGRSLNQNESQFGRDLALKRDTFQEGKRRFNFENFINRPFWSTAGGKVMDVSGKSLGYNKAFDYSKLLGPLYKGD